MSDSSPDKRDQEVYRLHGLIEELAMRFRGYLPWPEEKRDSVVRGHEAAIKDIIKKADAIAVERMSASVSHELPQELIEGVHFLKDGDRYIATHPDMPAPPSSIGPRPERVDTAELVLELQTWAQNESRRPDGQGNFYLVDLLEKAVTALAVPSAIAPHDDLPKAFAFMPPGVLTRLSECRRSPGTNILERQDLAFLHMLLDELTRTGEPIGATDGRAKEKP